MHQSQNIPWLVFAEHTKFIAHQPAFPNRPPQLVSRGRTGAANALNHFLRTLVSAIEEFSRTERKKYRPSREFTFPNSGNLFSDDFKARHALMFDHLDQKIEKWIPPAADDSTTSNDAFADLTSTHCSRLGVITAPMAENDMDTLLMLANHPQIPLRSLFRSGIWAHEQTSLFRALETAFSSYLFFNITAATGDLDNGNWRRMYWYQSTTLYRPAPYWCYPADKITHGQFLHLWKTVPPGNAADMEIEGDDHHPDYQVLHEDLKREFELMYRYDMFLREMGVESPWQTAIVRIVASNVGSLKSCARVDEDKEWPE